MISKDAMVSVNNLRNTCPNSHKDNINFFFFFTHIFFSGFTKLSEESRQAGS